MTPKFSRLIDVQAALRSGALTCRELVDYYLQNAKSGEALNAYVEIYESEAREQADAIDQLLANQPDQLGPCFGLVIAVKDNICQKGKKVTAASHLLKDFTALYSATALERLIAGGAIVIGRNNCDQFGMGSSNENSVYGPVKNADDESRVPGGSSGGSAVAVQIDSCLVAMGSDTGGSIRQPAGFCGLYGLKPTYGRISRHGLLAYASSFDQIGFIARSPEDLALMLEWTAGADEQDASMLDLPAPKIELPLAPLKKIRVAYLEDAMQQDSMDPEIREAHEDLLKSWTKLGIDCQPVAFDLLDYVVPTYYTLTTAEASANLARYDGIRYGQRVPGDDLISTYAQSRTEGFSSEVKRRILLGTFVLSAGYYDAYYGKAQRIRAMLTKEVESILTNFDLILLPISPIPAWKIGKKQANPTEMYLADIFTVLANLCGLPALSIPLRKHSNGTYFGYQMLTSALFEKKLLQFASGLESDIY